MKLPRLSIPTRAERSLSETEPYSGVLQGWEASTPSSITRQFIGWDEESHEIKTLPPSKAYEEFRFSMGSRGLERRAQKVEKAAKKARELHLKRSTSQELPTTSLQQCKSWIFDDDKPLKSARSMKHSGKTEPKSSRSKAAGTVPDTLFCLPVKYANEDQIAIKKHIREFTNQRKAVALSRKKLSLTPRGYEFDPDAEGLLRPSILVSRTLNLLKTQSASPREHGKKAKEAAMVAARGRGVFTTSYDVDDLNEKSIASAYLPSRSFIPSRGMCKVSDEKESQAATFLTEFDDDSQNELHRPRKSSVSSHNSTDNIEMLPWHIYGKPVVWTQRLRPREKDFLDVALEDEDERRKEGLSSELQSPTSSIFHDKIEVNCEKLKKWDFPQNFDIFLSTVERDRRKEVSKSRVAVGVFLRLSGIREKEFLPADDVAIREGILTLVSWTEYSETETIDNVKCSTTRGPTVEDVHIFKCETLPSNVRHLRIGAIFWCEKSDAPKKQCG